MANSQFNTEAVIQTLQARAQRLVAHTTFAGEAHVKSSMAEPKSGQVRPDGHQASAPGESPAIDEGTYVNSIQSEVEGLQGVFGTNQERGPALEFGSVHIEPRPHIAPALEAIRPGFEKGLQELFK